MVITNFRGVCSERVLFQEGASGSTQDKGAPQNDWFGFTVRGRAIALIDIKGGKAAMQITSTQAEENCLQAVDELMAKRQRLQDVFAAQNSSAEKAQAQMEEERKKFLAIDR